MSSNSGNKTEKQVNGMPETKLKQARLPFKTTTIKRSTPETGKKRKHEDDTENAADKGSQPVYIDLTETNEISATQTSSSDDTDVKSSKVCIIQGEPKYEVPNSEPIEGASDAVESTKPIENSKHTEKLSSLQKWFKPKKVEVTNTNEQKNSDSDEKDLSTKPPASVSEPMEIDALENSAVVDKSKKCNGQDTNSDEPSINESADERLNVSPDTSVCETDKSLDTSEVTTPTTPKSSLSLNKKLTPKRRQKREEVEQKRLEKERLKQEKEKKRLEEKEERQRQKEEKEKKRLAEIEAKNEEKRQKEEERKSKEEEKKRQKEEERKQKEEEKKQKEEEKRQKEEERKRKEEDKRLKEEQKREKEEHERKLKEKTAAAFTNFFLPKNKEQQKETTEYVEKTSHTMFMPFEVKANMKLASILRVTMSQEKLRLLDESLQNNQDVSKDSLYLAQLKSKYYQPGHSENTWPLSTADAEDDEDVTIVENTSDSENQPVPEKPMRYRCKLLQFHDNKRPAYWGTWRKRSQKISGRTPFKQEEIFDYEVDSDEEWEDEPGESVDSSEDEKEPEDDYEVDNDVFVPHGYLSDEEAQNEDAIDSSPKSNKLKLNILERQFEEEMKEKTHKLKPRVFGCIWINNSVKKDEGANNVENLLLAFKGVYDEKRIPFVISLRSNEPTPQNTPSIKAKLKNEFPDTLLPDLVKLAHGNKKNANLLAKEFNAYVLSQDSTLNLTLSCITKKLKEISTWVSHLACRLVNEEVRNQCGMANLSHTENTWKYITVCEEPATEKSQKTDPDKQPTTAPIPPPGLSSQNQKIKPSVPSITKFVKKLTAAEKQMAFNEIVPDKPIEKATLSPKTKLKTGITKFVKILNSQSKNATESANKKLQEVTIDLTDDESSEIKSISESNVHKSSDTVETRSESSILALPSTDGAFEKPVNILIPKKANKSSPVNVLIPRKTPSRPITNAAKPLEVRQDPNHAHIPNPEKNDVQKNIPSDSKHTNVLITRKANDLLKAENNVNSKSVNVLIPRRASDSRNSKLPSSPHSKPVNVLIPRRAKDIQKKELSKTKCDSVEKVKAKESVLEEAKDFIEDNASSDFSLCIESGDTSELK